MDSNNWRPNPPGGEPALDTGDWRAQLQADSRSRIVNKIMETLKRHLPFSGQEGLNELRKIAVRFEEKIYTAATSQSDYLRKISLKMLTMETKSQTNIANSLPSNSEANTGKPPDPGSLGMPSQVHNQAQSLPIPFSANQPQARQQLLSLDIQNNITPGSVQSSSGLPSSLPQASNLTQTSLPNVGQNSYMQSLSGVSQNLVGNSMGQGIPSNMFANSQSQMQGRQQVPPQQAQQQSQNPQQYLYQQQIHQQIKLQQGNLPQSMRQSHIQQQQQMQQQQQKLAPPTKLPWSEQSDMQTISVMEPSNVLLARLPDLQQQQLMQIVRKYSNDMSKKTDEHSVFVLDHQLKNPLQQELVIKKTSAVPEASSNMMPHLPGCLFLFLLFLWLYACYA